jgi:uncharacterized membrane protein YfcA
VDISVGLMILGAGLFAGFVDAIAGGGGLITIPALMLGGLPVHGAIATNKLCGTTGCLTSSLKFAHAGLVDWRACATMGLPAIVGALLGSRLIAMLSNDWAEPIVIVLLIGVTLWVLFKPKFGSATPDASAAKTPVSMAKLLQSAALGTLFGFHDGFFGAGTGAFIVFALLALWSLDFVRGTGSAKVINLMTNVTAVISFLWMGAVDLRLGVLASVGVVGGAYAGATVAATKGARVVKPIFVIVTVVIIGKLLIGYLAR